MATTHLPPLLQNSSLAPLFEPQWRSERYYSSEDESEELSCWLKLETDLPGPVPASLPSLNYSSNWWHCSEDDTRGGATPFSFAAPPSFCSATGQLPTLQPSFVTNYTSSFSFPSLPSVGPPTAPTLSSAPSPSSLPPSAYSSFGSGVVPPCCAAAASAGQVSNGHSQKPNSTHSGKYAPYTMPSSQPQFVPVQAISPMITAPNPVLLSADGTYQHVGPQFQLMFSQFQQAWKTQGEEVLTPLTEDKKRKHIRPFERRVRQTRPKVVEAKGSIQCKGRNRKKGIQCRNAALMEYVGPRPIYCAEHIELDPNTLYEKCKSPYQKEVGDNKGCKEVVLKEFGTCYKHYGDYVREIMKNGEFQKMQQQHERICELLSQLEIDAATAKKQDGDLYQRKNKLIPKFQEMKKIAARVVEFMEAQRQKDLSQILCSDFHDPDTALGEPVFPRIIDAELATPMAEGISSQDEDFFSSPSSQLSEEDFLGC